ncbi:MAG: transposase, partial [Methanoregula sp.]|nr:transposase [Methanoregula sp.]
MTEFQTAIIEWSMLGDVLTRTEGLSLEEPEFRKQPFEMVVFEKYCRVELALINVLTESRVVGALTRKICTIIEKWGLEHRLAGTVSHLGKECEKRVNGVLNSLLNNRLGTSLLMRFVSGRASLKIPKTKGYATGAQKGNPVRNSPAVLMEGLLFWGYRSRGMRWKIRNDIRSGPRQAH